MAWTPFTRRDHDRSLLRYTSDMSDREFALISPLLPGQPRCGRKRRVCPRSVINAIFYVLQNGCARANLPKDFPAKSTVYGYFRRFIADGTWARLHDALYVDCRDLEDREPQPSAAIIDSQSIKTGTNARDDVGYDALSAMLCIACRQWAKKVKGRTRHVLVDTVGLLLRCDVQSAGIQDRDGARPGVASPWDSIAARGGRPRGLLSPLRM